MLVPSGIVKNPPAPAEKWPEVPVKMVTFSAAFWKANVLVLGIAGVFLSDIKIHCAGEAGPVAAAALGSTDKMSVPTVLVLSFKLHATDKPGDEVAVFVLSNNPTGSVVVDPTYCGLAETFVLSV